MTRYSTRIYATALALGWACNYLFWEQSPGANFAIFTGLCLVGGLALLISTGHKPALKTLPLLLPAVFFAGVSVIRHEPLTRWLAFAGALLSLALLAASYQGGRWARYSLLDYLERFLRLTFSLVASPVTFTRQVQAERGKLRLDLPVKPVLRGFAIALPILFVFTYLLASADLVFNQQVTSFFEHFKVSEILENFARLALILLCAYALVGVFLHAASRSRDEKLTGEDKPVFTPFLGFIETSVVLISVSTLLLLFVIVQFQYFFGGQTNIGVEGYTYSEYARRGFNELVMVAFLSLLLALGLSTFSQRENERQRVLYSVMSAALLVLDLVILVSAYQRLWLAIGWHGFSRLRLYPLVFMVWVGLLFLAVVALEVLRRERYFAFAALLASLGFAASLAFINVDAAIVRVNVERARQGKHFNVTHLAGLSNDAVPALVEAFQDPRLNQDTREGVGVALTCFRYNLQNSPDGTQDWRSWEYSEYQARAALYHIRAELRDYGTNDDYWPVKVFAPGGDLYLCAE